MVTITLEQSENLDKTHFTNLDELLAYLNSYLAPKFPHEDPEFMDELERRSKAFGENPSSAVPFKETLNKIRNHGK